MDLRAGPDISENRKISCSYRQIKANMLIAASFWDKVTRDLRRLHELELWDLHSSQNIIQVKKLILTKTGGTYSTYGGEESCILNFNGESCVKETTLKT